LAKLAGDLRKRGIKLTRRSNGTLRGGIPFTKGPLAYLLKNRVYIGDIIHKGRHYPGEHEPILDRELFEAVQCELASRAQARGQPRIHDASLLTGRIFDDRANRMSPSTCKKGSARYRYYVSAALLQGRREDAGSVPRVPALDVETAVIGALGQIADDAARTGQAQNGAGSDRDLIDAHLDKIVVRKNAIEITPRNIGSALRQLRSPFLGHPLRSRDVARSSCLIEGIAKARL
jgi:site-specific DNA recombinase